MPQMNPLNWLFISLLVILWIIILLEIIYFNMYLYPLSSSDKKIKKSNFLLKW